MSDTKPQAAPAALAATSDAGGRGADSQAEPQRNRFGQVMSERRESGLTAIQEARLRRRALREGWGRKPGEPQEQPWDFGATAQEFDDQAKAGEPLTLEDQLVRGVLDDMASDDPRVKGEARKAAFTMKDQNIAIDALRLARRPATQGGPPDQPADCAPGAAVQVNVNVSNSPADPKPVSLESLTDEQLLEIINAATPDGITGNAGLAG